MKRVAEIIYVVESEREAFLKGALHLDAETEKVLWRCGVRKQQYFALNDLIFMTFEYKGHDFKNDMAKMANYLDSKGLLIKKRRKEVPVEERATTNWWAPVKKLGTLLEHEPHFGETEEDWDIQCMGMSKDFSGYYDISFDENDWMEGMHI